jgi:hypothetical protein
MSEVVFIQGKYPHIGWLNYQDENKYEECAVVKKYPDGSWAIIPLKSLDDVDKQRIYKFVTSSQAPRYELWEIMKESRLGNGVNALTYFHQLVILVTPDRKVSVPNEHFRMVSNKSIFDAAAARQQHQAKEVVEAEQKAKAKTKAKKAADKKDSSSPDIEEL